MARIHLQMLLDGYEWMLEECISASWPQIFFKLICISDAMPYSVRVTFEENEAIKASGNDLNNVRKLVNDHQPKVTIPAGFL
jgi:hypothetical protein